MLGQAPSIVIAITTVLGSLAILAVSLRLYCRYLQKLPLKSDDYCIVVALILSTAISILIDYTAATTGVGDTSYVPSPEVIVFGLKVDWIFSIIQVTALGFAKVSLLCYYRRIFVLTWFLRYTMGLICFIFSYTLTTVLVILFCKWPIRDQWNPDVPYNINLAAMLLCFVTFSTASDLATLALPLIALRGLNMRAQRKLFLSTIFTVGSLCMVTSICRLYYAARYVNVTETASSLFQGQWLALSAQASLLSIISRSPLTSQQVPWVFNILWALIEPPAFIITGCLLTFGPLYRSMKDGSTFFNSLLSRYRRGRHTSELGSFTERVNPSTRSDSDQETMYINDTQGEAVKH